MYLFTCIRLCKRDGHLHAYTHTHQGVTHTLQESQHLPAGCHTHRRAHPQKKEKAHTQISREFRAHTDSYLLRDTQIGGVINYGKTSHQKWVTKKNPASSAHTRICTCMIRMQDILRRIHMCDMTHSYVWHDSCIRVTLLNHMHDMTHSCLTSNSYARHYSFRCVTVTSLVQAFWSCVWHDSFTSVTGLIHLCDMNDSHVWHDSSSTTHSYVCHDSFIHVT